MSNRWTIRFLPLIEKMTRKCKRLVGGSWRMDKMYINVKGVWKYLYRSVDKEGETDDFLRRRSATWLGKALLRQGHWIERRSGQGRDGQERRNKTALDAFDPGRPLPILVRQVKYIDNIVEQGHRAIKRVTGPLLNFISFCAAGSVLARIKLMHMIREGEFTIDGAGAMSFGDQFSALVAKIRPE